MYVSVVQRVTVQHINRGCKPSCLLRPLYNINKITSFSCGHNNFTAAALYKPRNVQYNAELFHNLHSYRYHILPNQSISFVYIITVSVKF